MENINDKKIIPAPEEKFVLASVSSDKPAEVVKPENTVPSKNKDISEVRKLTYPDVYLLERAIRMPEIIEKVDENTTILSTKIKGVLYEKTVKDWREYFILGILLK